MCYNVIAPERKGANKIGCACSSVDRVPGYEPVGRGFESPQARQKETTIFERRLSFLFVLCTFLSSLFPLLSNCRFQRKDKREKRREKVVLLCKTLNLFIKSFEI